MVRRLISTVALVAGLASYAFAITERANFILTTGEKKSGRVVFHGDLRENLINGHLNLGVDDGGKEMTFPVDQVAVIDFVGGQPGLKELAQLGSGPMLVLRDGTTQQGRFVNMVGGDTLIWENQSGQNQRYAIRDVSRVYLNPQSARIAFNYEGLSGAGAAGTSAAGTVGTVPPANALRVEANRAWTDSGLTVKRGERVAFQANGQIQFGQSPGQTAMADGNVSDKQATFPVPSAAVGALIGKVGNSAPFVIGSQTQPLVMPASGRLMLGINDNELDDNSGFFSVVITKQPGRY